MRKLLLISLMTTLLLGFNNCSEVKFSRVENSFETLDPGDIEEVLNNCQTAQSNGSLQTYTGTIVFEDTGVESGRPGNICEFGVGDNLDIKNGYLRARYDQAEPLNLPAGAVLCDLDMGADVQSFRYDDVFFLTLNNRLLATNNANSIGSLAKNTLAIPNTNYSIDFLTYDWLGVRDTTFQNNTRDDYCLGTSQSLSTCAWPLTEQSGQIDFQFARELLVAITANRQGNANTFGFTITGDNDKEVDCFHKRLELDVVAQYYIAP